MSTLTRIREALGAAARGLSRGIGAFGGWISEGDRLKDPNSWGLGGWGRKTQSGEHVSPERALTLSAYYAGLRNISEDVAKLPLITYERLEPRGKKRAPDHVAYRMLKTRANPEMSSITARRTLLHWAIGWGRGCAEIVRDGAGRPRQYWPIHPSRIYPDRREGQLGYVVSRDDLMKDPKARPLWLPARDVLHIHGLGNGNDGYSLAQLAAESIGLGLAAQLQAASFFGNGSQYSGVLEHPGRLSDKAQANLRASWMEMHAGARNAYKPAILEEGLKFSKMSAAPKDAQLIESRSFQVEDIARWLRTPPSKIGHHPRAQGWATLEMMNTDYVVDTLLPWIICVEQELDEKVFEGDDRYFAEHNVAALLRGDMAARGEFYRTLVNIASLSPNDVRELENMNPIPDPAADLYYMQLNMAPLGMLADGSALKTPAGGGQALALAVHAARNGDGHAAHS